MSIIFECTFSEETKEIETSFSEETKEIETNFGEYQTLKGEKGDKGDKGDKGEQGIQGIQGEQGEKGEQGYTPQKGTDYFTEEEKEAFALEVKAKVFEELINVSEVGM